MSQNIPIYIPTYINNEQYAPVRVLPRLLFYNGMLECEQWYIQSGSLTEAGISYAQNSFPYFDNYNVVTGSFPTTGSLSLLFNNEGAAYGTSPNESLYTQYWEKYISLLYNPYTRLFNCEGIIPLADYFNMELNDIVQWRGNYYHLRAINDYNLKNGECKIQLLGPILEDVITNLLPEKDCGFSFTSSVFTTTTTTTAPPTVLYQVSFQANIGTRAYSYTDYNGTARSYSVNTTPVAGSPALLTYRFAAQKNSVSLPLGASLSTLQDPFTPQFISYDVFYGPSTLATYWIGYQEKPGNHQKYTNYTYQTNICIVSGSFTNTGGTFPPGVVGWRLSNPNPC